MIFTFLLVVYTKPSPNCIPEPTLDLRWLHMKAHHKISENISSSDKLVLTWHLSSTPNIITVVNQI